MKIKNPFSKIKYLFNKNRVGEAFSPTRAPGADAAKPHNFLSAPVCIKKSSVIQKIKKITIIPETECKCDTNSKVYKACRHFNRYSLIYQFILACLLCFIIEAVSRHSITAALAFGTNNWLVFLYNSLIIYLSFLPVYLFKRRTLYRIIAGSVWLFLGTVNGCLLLNRVTPFGYTDLKLITDLLEMKNNYFSTFQMILLLCGIGLFILLCVILFIKGPLYHGKRNILFNAALLGSCFLCVPFVTDAAVDSHVLTDYFANIAEGYENYGFVYGFSVSLLDQGMEKPDNYIWSSIAAIEDNIDREMESDRGSYAPPAAKKPNVILVLLESFVDPDEINGLNLSKDAVPNFHALKENYSSGYLKVPVVGAGTANTEFEVLTGMNMKYFGTGEYPYKTTLKKYTCESIAGSFKDLGYGTHVVHNNGGNFYSRANAFSQMGFDTFTSKELMDITEYTPLGTWAKDDILVSETMKTLDATPDSPDFSYVITVEGHGAYPSEKVLENPEITVSSDTMNEKELNQWEYYVNQLHSVDQFIYNLTEELSKRDEDTLVVFFGDHLPSMNLTDEDVKSGNLFYTNYVTWNNFGMEKKDCDLTTYQLMAEMTAQINVHNGTMFRLHQALKDTPGYEDSMEKLQYDILFGQKYAYGQKDLYPASDLVMGIDDVVIRNILPSSDRGTLLITGNGFTNWSRVFINDEKVSTEYVSSTMLKIKAEDIKDVDEPVVTVCQMGSSNTKFRVSNEYLYE